MYRTRLTTEPVQLIDCAYTWYYGHWYPLPPESLNVTLTRMLHTGDHTISQSVLTTRVCMERAENLWRIALNPEMADFEDVARTLFTTESVDKLRRDMSVRPDGYFAEKSTAELLVTAAAQRDEQRYQLRSDLTEDRTDETRRTFCMVKCLAGLRQGRIPISVVVPLARHLWTFRELEPAAHSSMLEQACLNDQMT